MPTEKEKKVQWHPACYAALNLEFADNKRDLTFQQELALNELPYRLDALIIKKTKKCIIKNEIGKLFRIHNLVEYKAPETTLNFNTFLKGIENLLMRSKGLVNAQDKKNADAIWEIVTKNNTELIKLMGRDPDVCKAMAELFRTEFTDIVDAAVAEAVDAVVAEAVDTAVAEAVDAAVAAERKLAFNDGCVQVFQNMIKNGLPREEAQKYAQISDELVEKALASL